MIKLYTFAISHFSEKVRWALDDAGVPYTEYVLVPGPHMMTTRRLAQRSEVPILIHDGRVVQGSSTIVDYIEKVLEQKGADGEPDKLSRELESELDRSLGRGVQTVVYSNALDSERSWVTKLWSLGGPRWAPALYGFAYPVVSSAVKRMYRTADSNAVEKAQKRFDDTLDRLDSMLAESPYLHGERPGRLDRVAAALLAPIFVPDEHPMAWPTTPDRIRALTGRYDARPIAEHVRKMYREHRHRRATPYRLSSVRRHLPV